jgi:hypothetical protein
MRIIRFGGPEVLGVVDLLDPRRVALQRRDDRRDLRRHPPVLESAAPATAAPLVMPVG